mgnify:FL=1|tara:strand:+ start:1891 stop:2328 length:438 start_codon:yes stop_codon:yes gene_type:complete
MYVRFVLDRQDPDSGFCQGVFMAAGVLRDSGLLEPWEEAWLTRELDWCKMHLKVPACLKLPENRRAICWFHPRAKRPMEKVRSIAALLADHGYLVRMIKSRDPGQIIYRDGWQVVAKPPHRRTGRRAQNPIDERPADENPDKGST